MWGKYGYGGEPIFSMVIESFLPCVAVKAYGKYEYTGTLFYSLYYKL
jgi:hypothetical protein